MTYTRELEEVWGAFAVRHGVEHPHAAVAQLNLAHALLAVSPSEDHPTPVHTALGALDACLAQLAAELAQCDEPSGCTRTAALQATASEARALRATALARTGRRKEATAARQAEVQTVTALLGLSHAAAIAALTALAADALEHQPPRADEAVEALTHAVAACTVVEPSDGPAHLQSVDHSPCDTAAAAHAANAAAVVAAAAGRLDEALTLRRQCMALASWASAPTAQAAFLDNDAALLTRVGRADEALAAARSSLRIRRRAFEDRAGIDEEEADAVEAMEAVEAVEAVPSLRAMARAWEAKGNVDHAQRAYAAAVTLLDTGEATRLPFGPSSESAARVRKLSQAHVLLGSSPCMHSLRRRMLLMMTYAGGGGGAERLRSAFVAAGPPPPSAACPRSRAAREGSGHEHWRRRQCGGGCGGGGRGESGHIAVQSGAGTRGVAWRVQRSASTATTRAASAGDRTGRAPSAGCCHACMGATVWQFASA